MSNLFKHKLLEAHTKIQLYVISKALKLLQELDKDYQQWVEETRQKVEIAVEKLEIGEGLDEEVVVKRLREKLRKARDNQS